MSEGRLSGVRHRRKVTVEGEARPTVLYVVDLDNTTNVVSLESEDDELVFLRDGVKPGDRFAMVMGGSGDALAVGLHRAGGVVMRIPPFVLKKWRGEGDKKEDAALLYVMALTKPELFYTAAERDLAIIRVSALQGLVEETMATRIACGNRIRQRFVGKLLMENGLWPGGKIEDLVKAELADDKIYEALEAEENRYVREMTNELNKLDVWTALLEPVEGIGPKIAARILASVQDVRRFPTEHAFKAYCGLGCGPKGEFVRRRRGEVANYSPTARQAAFLLMDQFNRRPNSLWGQKLVLNKARLREKHPYAVLAVIAPDKSEILYPLIPGEHSKDAKTGVYTITVDGVAITGLKGKLRYTPVHIKKMAGWRTATQFYVWLYRAWTRLENEQAQVAPKAAAA